MIVQWWTGKVALSKSLRLSEEAGLRLMLGIMTHMEVCP